MLKEIWKDVVGYEGIYRVSNLGNIMSVDRVIIRKNGYRNHRNACVITQHFGTGGYCIVPLTVYGKTKFYRVHRLVAEAFIPNPNNWSEVNHKDEDKTNNCVDNLEWCTHKYNNNYGNKPKTMSKVLTGRQLSLEHKQHISDGHARRKLSTKKKEVM